MAGVGHEAALALQRTPQAGEQVVERLAEPADLVVRGGQRQLLVAGGGAPPHRLDRPQGGAGQRVAEQRGENDGERAAEREGRNQAGQDLVTVFERLADHDNLAAGVGHALREDPCRAVDAPYLSLAAHRLDRPASAAGRLEHAAVVGHDAGEAVLGLTGHARGDARSRHGGGARRERVVHGLVEVGAHPGVDEQPGGREHERHRGGEGHREPDADRQPAHRRSR